MAEPEAEQLSFREMTLKDLDVVLQTEARAYQYPWTRGIFADCLTARHDCRVLCVDGEIAGHAVLSAAAGEAHLLNVCIKRELQGRGLGRRFVRYLIKRAQLLGAQMMFLEVRPSNRVALALYDSLGFVHVGTRKDYYPSEQQREDAWVLALDLLQLSDH